LGGLPAGDLRADDDLAVMEGDHIGRSLDVHEFPVDAVAGLVIHERDLQSGEMEQGRILNRGVGEREFGRFVGDVFEAVSQCSGISVVS
jgi:hypothetical protein